MELVIVESPSKAKTIEKYLGGSYRVSASGGHVRDLPEKRLGVDIENNYEPNYTITADKKTTIKKLKDMSNKAEKIYLATDPDREGEAISWHLQEVLEIKDKAVRIEFNEISANAIKKAIANPRDINYNLVDSQQARRVMDRLVGYKLSPYLCKKIKDGLSAGRVQSVTLKLVVDREREIQAFIPQEYWTISALYNGEKVDFKALLTDKNGKKYKPTNKEESEAVVNTLKNNAHVVKEVKRTIQSVHALPPFTTSTLQQDATSKLNLTSPQVMQLAQHLYEGLETDEGHLALVTYIRTDSTRVSFDAQKKALDYIEQVYGKDYVPEKPNFYKSKKSAQDAHEAIRPIDINRTPEKVKKLLDAKHYKLYKLIYDRFIASQMSDARFDNVVVNIDCQEYGLRASGKVPVFAGYTAVYKNTMVEEEDSKILPDCKEGEELKLKDITHEQKFTKPPVRYTDSTLVKTMEDKGIGRPSTYASILGVLSGRKYVKKDGKNIVPNEIAYQMTDILVKFFPEIMDIGFTASMEDKLDDIENGGKDWKQLIGEFYPPFAQQLVKASRDGDELTDIVCEKCGELMVRRNGKFGKYLACSNYPKCSNMRSENIVLSQEKCEKCGAFMAIKNGKYGEFLACSNYPKCSNIRSTDEEKSQEKCEKCGEFLVIKNGKFGKYLSCANCKTTRSLVEVQLLGICPICKKPTKKMKSKGGKDFFGCSDYPNCKFMSWDEPTGELCPKCNKPLVYDKNRNIKCSAKDCAYSPSGEENK